MARNNLGPKARTIIKRDQQFLSTSYTRENPLVVGRAADAEVWDVDDRRFIDLWPVLLC